MVPGAMPLRPQKGLFDMDYTLVIVHEDGTSHNYACATSQDVTNYIASFMRSARANHSHSIHFSVAFS